MSTNNDSYKTYEKKLKERLQLQEENHSISAQDNYAKWTKNNRRLEKLNEDLKSLSEQLKVQRNQTTKLLKSVKLVSLTVPFLILKLWKGKFPVYYLPHAEVFPKIIGGVLSQGWLYLGLLPLRILRGGNKVEELDIVPKVSVSLGIWIWAFTSVLATLEFLVNQFVFTKKLNKPILKTAPTEAEKVEFITHDEVELD